MTRRPPKHFPKEPEPVPPELEGNSALRWWTRLIEQENIIDSMQTQLGILSSDNIALREEASQRRLEGRFQAEREQLLELVRARDDQIAPHEARIGTLEGKLHALLQQVRSLEHQVAFLQAPVVPPEPTLQKTVLGALQARQDAEQTEREKQKAEWAKLPPRPLPPPFRGPR